MSVAHPHTHELPQLLDTAMLARELGIKRSSAEAIMRKLPTVHFDGLRKTFVKRADVHDLIAQSTCEKTRAA